MSLAFVFPGQGSQSVGMLSELATAHQVVTDTFAEASEALGFDLWALVQNGPKEELDATANTQPAMLAAGVAIYRTWRDVGGPQPAYMAGHSLGEYSALVASGALDFSGAVHLVKNRASLMQNAVPADEGAMAAVLGLDEDAINDVCDNASGIGVAEAVNFNSPGQVVVAGHKPAIERLIELAKSAGARRAIMLPVSVPSHSSLMRSAGDRLAKLLDELQFKDPQLPVVCAVDGRPYGDANDVRERIKLQVFSPVRWVDTVVEMRAKGVNRILEFGPGKVLTGLIKRIDRDVDVTCIDSLEPLHTALNEVSA